MRVDPHEVTSASDPRITSFIDLTDMDLRLRTEADHGLFIAEGHLVLERCVTAGLDLLSVLTSPRWLERLETILADLDVPVYVAEETVLREITGYRVHRGALAAVRRPADQSPGTILDLPGDILVLEDLVDPTNVGLAVRSAVVQGITSVLLSPRCADPLYRRAVKSSMGTVLRTRWARCTDWSATLAEISRRRTLVALTPDGSDSLEQAMASASAEGVAIMLGAEGPGLSPGALGAAGFRCSIPMAGPEDSLNVAAAAAVACYVRSRARTMQS